MGGFAAGALVVTAVLLYLRRQKRSNKDTGKATPQNPPLFAPERVVGPEGYYEVGKRRFGEMDGQSLGRREELDAGPQTAEIGTGQKREGREGRWELPS